MTQRNAATVIQVKSPATSLGSSQSQRMRQHHSRARWAQAAVHLIKRSQLPSKTNTTNLCSGIK